MGIRSPGYLLIGVISVGVWWYRKVLIDDTSVWSSDDTRGGGPLHQHRGVVRD